MSTPVLVIKDLTLDLSGSAPRRLVDSLSLTLERGRTTALVGENGAGKSITSLAVMDLLPEGVLRTGGTILIDGRDLDQLNNEDKRSLRGSTVAMVMQHPMSAFDPVFTIRSHFTETLRAHEIGLSSGQEAERSRSALVAAGFTQPDAILDIYPFQMSGGMLQRTMVALALLLKPALLIADEATTDLDVISQKQILDLLRKRREEDNLGMLLITHDLSVAASLADNVSILYRGVLVETGPVEQVFASPKHPYTQSLLASHYALYDGPFSEWLCQAEDDVHAVA